MDAADLRAVALAPLLATAGYLSWRYLSAGRNRLPRPPGPKGVPILQNVFDIPMKTEWLAYRKYAEQYGDLVYLEALGRSILILDSPEAVNDLLERRGSIYSDRPVLQMINLTGFIFTFSIKPYGDEWRTYRRIFHQHVHMNVADQYHPVQTWSTRIFLRRLLEEPTEFMALNKEFLARTILQLTYDIQINGQHDPYVTAIDDAVEGVTEAVIPGKYMVEFLPWLRHVPEWMPGAGFKRDAARCYRNVQKMIFMPFNTMKESMRKGTNRPSMMSRMLEEGPADDPRYEKIVREIGALAYAAGVETTLAACNAFCLAMLQFPDVQTHARAELDAVVGLDRPVEFADRSRLPYVEAVVSEVLRWMPPLPMGVPHATTEDDVYRGYHIPKGTIVMYNTWSMLHDPEVYAEPEAFKPERFLKEVDGGLQIDRDVRDPRIVTFGAGRRICAGRHIAENSFWLYVASFLQTISVEPALDDAGLPIEPKVELIPGFTSQLRPFQASMKPRSARAETLIRESAAEAHL